MGDEETLGRLGSRYLLHEVIGEGGMGMVYRATDRLTNKQIALKKVITAPSALMYNSRPSDTLDGDQYRIGLANEFRHLASLRHPHIISVLDYGFDERRRPYFTMELLPQPETILAAAKPLDINGKIDLIIQLLFALSYLHRRGLLHRDLKPANVMVVDGRVKVLDFGLAVAQGQARDLSGTYAYMAPEVLRGEETTVSADLYAVGVLCFEMLAEQHPHETADLNKMLNHILFQPVNLSLLEDSESLMFVVGRLLEKEPSLRYTSADEVGVALSKAIGRPLPRETSDVRDSYLQAADFVGREQEVSRFDEALEQLRQGNGSAWLVGGESGIGKTRLISEVRTLALVKGINVLRGQAVAEGGSPYQVWREVLRLLCLQSDLSLMEAAVLKAIVPDIGRLLQRKVPDAPELDARAAQRRLLTVVEDVFSRQTDPVLIVLEDLQWTQESLDLLQRVSRNVKNKPVMFLGSFRNDERPDLPELLPHMTLVLLERLPRVTIQRLATSMLGKEAAASDDMLDLLERETEGNVFFIVEVMRSLAEEAGNLKQILQMDLPEKVFAKGIMTVVEKRLERVPEDARGLLTLAAVASRALDLKVIRNLAGKGDIDDWLTTCANAAVLDVQDNRWRFAHDRLREVMVNAMSPEDRHAAHAKVARAIEAVYMNDDSRVNALAHHWREAGDRKKEAHFAAQAGQQALRSGAHEEALELLERALELSEEAGMSEERIALIETQLGNGYFSMGQLARSRPHLRRAVELLGLPEAKSKPLGLLWEVVRQLWFRLMPERKADKDSAKVMRHATASRATMLLSAVGLFENERIKAIYYTIRSLNLAEKVGKGAIGELAHGYGSMSIAAGTVGVEGLAERYVRLHDDLHDEIDSLEEQAAALRVTAIYKNSYGRWQDVYDRFGRAAKLAEEAGQYRLWAESMTGILRAKFFSGDMKDAKAGYTQVAEVTRRQNDEQYEAVCISALAEIALRSGQVDEALEMLNKSMPIHHNVEDTAHELYSYGVCIRAHLARTDYEQAREMVRKAEGIINIGPPVAYWTLEGYGAVAEYWLDHWKRNPTEFNRKKAQEALKHLGVYANGFPIGEPRYEIMWSRFEQLSGKTIKARRIAEEAIEAAVSLQMVWEELTAREQLLNLLEAGSEEAKVQRKLILELEERLGVMPEQTEARLVASMV